MNRSKRATHTNRRTKALPQRQSIQPRIQTSTLSTLSSHTLASPSTQRVLSSPTKIRVNSTSSSSRGVSTSLSSTSSSTTASIATRRQFASNAGDEPDRSHLVRLNIQPKSIEQLRRQREFTDRQNQATDQMEKDYLKKIEIQRVAAAAEAEAKAKNNEPSFLSKVLNKVGLSSDYIKEKDAKATTFMYVHP